MAKKGERKQQKTLSVSKARKLHRKKNLWTVRAETGPHNKNSVPLLFVARDLLGIAKNASEAEQIIFAGKIEVDGKVVTDKRYPVGLFDVVSLKGQKKNYRIVLNGSGQLLPKEISEKEKGKKLCKVVRKSTIKGKELQITTNDGRNFRAMKQDVRVGDTIIVEVPGQKVSGSLAMKEGNIAFIIGGKKVGLKGIIMKVSEGTMTRRKLIAVKPSEGEEFQTNEANIFVVGETRPELEGI